MKNKVFKDEFDFESLFLDDVDSWFSAEIGCCDNCYDDFLTKWPHAFAADDATFQRNSIDLGSFYSGSKLSEIYSEEEFNYFIKQVRCPNCGEPLSSNIWPYELPYDVDKKFETTLDEIAAIAQKTPFLLLKHPYSEKVLSAINELSGRINAIKIAEPLYRARTPIIHKPTLSHFDFPPKDVVKEGRYNHAGIPVLYLANNLKTCFYEIREQPCTVAEIQINKRLKILDFYEFEESDGRKANVLKTIVYSALLSSSQEDEGWHRPKYVFSRFVADCALNAGFDAIKYPSTRKYRENYNLVILNSEFSLSTDCMINQFLELRTINDIK